MTAWIAVLIVAGTFAAVGRHGTTETSVAAGGQPTTETDASPAPTTQPDPTTIAPTTVAIPSVETVLSTTTTVVQHDVTTTTELPASTEVPTTGIPLTTMLPPPKFAILPNQPLSGSGPDHFQLVGTGCYGARVNLTLNGGTRHDEWYDETVPLADGSWSIGMMIPTPGSYTMTADCSAADGSVIFTYGPRPFTIVP